MCSEIKWNMCPLFSKDAVSQETEMRNNSTLREHRGRAEWFSEFMWMWKKECFSMANSSLRKCQTFIRQCTGKTNSSIWQVSGLLKTVRSLLNFLIVTSPYWGLHTQFSNALVEWMLNIVKGMWTSKLLDEEDKPWFDFYVAIQLALWGNPDLHWDHTWLMVSSDGKLSWMENWAREMAQWM